MGSSSFSILAVLALAAALIGNSLALKCLMCFPHTQCFEKKCVVDRFILKAGLSPASTHYCFVGLGNAEGKPRLCPVNDDWKVVGGMNKCIQAPASKLNEMAKGVQDKYDKAIQSAISSGKVTHQEAQEYEHRRLDEYYAPSTRDNSDPVGKLCACDSEDLCNSDEGIKKLPVEVVNATSSLQWSGNLVAVIFLTLAAYVYGFLWSQ